MSVIATVWEIIGSEPDRLVLVTRENGMFGVFEYPDSESLSIGDTVLVEVYGDGVVFDKKVFSGGLNRGNTLCVVEKADEDRIVVNTGTRLTTVANGTEENPQVGDTVEISNANTIVDIVQNEPLRALPSAHADSESSKFIDNLRNKSDDIDFTYADFGGGSARLEQFKQRVNLFLNQREALADIGTDLQMGAIFYGEPGTGKTHFARILAAETDATFYRIRGPEIVTKWVGETEEIIRGLFEDAADNSPSIMFFDELDSLGSERRGGANQQFGNRVVAQLLSLMDGFDQSDEGILVIASTNRLDDIDDALLRSGRFDWKIKFPLPDYEGRVEIFDSLTNNYEVSQDIDSQQIARITEGWSGAEIDGLLDEAGLIAVDKNRGGSNEIRLVDILESYERIAVREER
jgi:transitional endoplasmic reticulum ATPase